MHNRYAQGRRFAALAGAASRSRVRPLGKGADERATPPGLAGRNDTLGSCLQRGEASLPLAIAAILPPVFPCRPQVDGQRQPFNAREVRAWAR